MMQFRFTPAVKGLSIAMLALFILERTADLFLGGNWISQLGLIPQSFVLDFKFWQIFTYSFLHNDVTHLVLNLMMLVFIGAELEGIWGWRRFLRYYFWCATSAGIFYLILQIFVGAGVGRDQMLLRPLIGASGAIYGLLIAYGILFGERVLLFMMLFPMKARNFVWVLAGVEFLTGVFGASGGLSSAAHLAGMFGGFGYLWGAARYRLWQREQESRPGGRSRGKSAKSLVSKAFGKAGPKLKLIKGGAPEAPSPSASKGKTPSGGGEPPTWH